MDKKRSKAILYIVVLAVVFLATSYFRYAAPSVGIIGGSDGPSAVFISGN